MSVPRSFTRPEFELVAVILGLHFGEELDELGSLPDSSPGRQPIGSNVRWFSGPEGRKNLAHGVSRGYSVRGGISHGVAKVRRKIFRRSAARSILYPLSTPSRAWLQSYGPLGLRTKLS